MKKILLSLVILAVIYSRFVGINWGLPYPMHPDERNMASALQSLSCDIKQLESCLHPNFFAYGQLPLYIGYVLVTIVHIITLKTTAVPITFNEATLALRILSALSSLVTVIVLYKIVHLMIWIKKVPTFFQKIATILVLSFAPYSIAFSHFGTTESMLMALFTIVLYLSLQLMQQRRIMRHIFLCGVVCGVALGVKLSSAIFLVVPFFALCVIWFKTIRKRKYRAVLQIPLHGLVFVVVMIAGYVLSSPYNVISYKEFLGSMNYESAVALGTVSVFYTRQFAHSLPVVFHIVKIFPYALGIPMMIGLIFSFFTLPFRNASYSIIRIALIVPFLVSGFMFAKWSRFISPVFPIASLVVALGMNEFYLMIRNFKYRNTVIALLAFILIIQGVAYISIYQNEDVRFTASEWIVKHIPENELILSETANVVDIPLDVPGKSLDVFSKKYSVVSFDFYNLDTNQQLQTDLDNYLEDSNYVLVPSRRVFANHTCNRSYLDDADDYIGNAISFSKDRCLILQGVYSKINNYYDVLFDQNRYAKVAEFHSYPRISFFGKTIVEFPDEDSEETWSVFDHPVIRVYRKI